MWQTRQLRLGKVEMCIYIYPIDENKMLMIELVEFKINGAVKYINVNDKYASKKA